MVKNSDVVLEDRPWPRGSWRTQICVLGLGLGLEGPGLGLGLGLECPGLGLGLRISALTTAFFDRYFFVYFLILQTFAVGQSINLMHGAP